jgi:hypothetical protein
LTLGRNDLAHAMHCVDVISHEFAYQMR